MKTQIITINNIRISIPGYYKQIDSMPEDPENSIAFAVQSQHATCFALLYPADKSKSLPRNKKTLISGIRDFLQDNQGIIQVDAELNYVYSIVKTLKKPHGIIYTLTYQKFLENSLIEIHAFFEEIGTTGMRDTLMCEYCIKNKLIGNDNNMFAGWAQDPYDKNYKKGALMNYSERAEFDQFFPDFPLSLCRAFISTVVKA